LPVLVQSVVLTAKMACNHAATLCLGLFLLPLIGSACDAAGMQKCNADYLKAVPKASGSEKCDVINSLVTCMNSKGAGCPSAALAQFNSMVDSAKAPVCVSAGKCANHTLCNGDNPSASSFAWRPAAPLFILVLLFFTLVEQSSACDAAGMQECNTDYLKAVPKARGSETCDVINSLVTCMNTKGAGCPAAALAQFNSMVDSAKEPECASSGKCANHTLCSSGAAVGSGTSSARMATSSTIVWAVAFFGMTLLAYGK